MNVGTPGPAPGALGPALDWYLTPGPFSISMCGLNALMLGWLTTCWCTAVVVVGEPGAVVGVVDPGVTGVGAVVVVVVEVD